MKLIALLLTFFALVVVSQAGGGCSLTVITPVSWNNPNPAYATFQANFQSRGGSTVTGTAEYTFSNGTSPVTESINTFASDTGIFDVLIPAYTTSVKLDVTLTAGSDSKRFRCTLTAP